MRLYVDFIVRSPMKALLKLNEFELVRDYQKIVLLKAGKVISKFALDQLFPAIIRLLSLSTQENEKLAANKLITNFQSDLF